MTDIPKTADAPAEPGITRGLITGREYPAGANRLFEEIGWVNLTRTCRHGHTQRLTVDERTTAVPGAGYGLGCYPAKGRKSPAPNWSVADAR